MTTYEKSFKEEALKLSDEIGVTKAAAQLGIPYYTLSNWRYRRHANVILAHICSDQKGDSGDEKDRRIRQLESENAELQRVTEILQEALSFFAKSRRK